MVDSGTVTLKEFNWPSGGKNGGVGLLRVTWTCGPGLATFEKTLGDLVRKLRGQILSIVSIAGATAPTNASELDVYDVNQSATTAPLIASTDANQGLNVISSTVLRRLIPLGSRPVSDTNSLRFIITNNLVNDATGDILIYFAPLNANL
jgi:hypothetical protein